MEEWRRNMERGRMLLRKHDPRGALKPFQSALEDCPVHCQNELSKILFYLGATLMKLGQTDAAIRTWGIGGKVSKSGYAVKMYRRTVNSYGMEKQISEEEDDWQAFKSVQLSKYMMARKRDTLPNPAELDMVTDLIRDTFCELRDSGSLDGHDCHHKTSLFERTYIVFPLTMAEFSHTLKRGRIIPVDFRNARKLDPSKNCTCGSGLPYRICCGRIGCDRLKDT